MAAPVTQESNAVAPPAVEEEAKEDEEECEDLSTMLENLGLSEYMGTFDEEKIDSESFVRFNNPYFSCYKVLKTSQSDVF